MGHLVAVDLETTGLNPELHEVIEVGLVWKSPDDGSYNEADFSLPFNIHRADYKALAINGWDRAGTRTTFPDQLAPTEAAILLQNVLEDAHIVGKNPYFDRSFLESFFRTHELEKPDWHHRMVDVGTVCMGRFKSLVPPNTMEVERMTGIKIPDSLRHTALGDAVWAWDVLHWVVNS